MTRWIRDARSLVDLAFIMAAFILLGGIMHLVTGRIVSATIAGAALGFLVSESARWRRERTQDRWVRRALRLEFDHNLNELAALWNEPDPVPVAGDPSLTALQTRFFVDIFPHWNRALWSSHVRHVGSALSDAEISAAMRMQSVYDRLMAPRDRVLSRAGEDRSSLGVDPEEWAAIEALTVRLLGPGNPIQ